MKRSHHGWRRVFLIKGIYNCLATIGAAFGFWLAPKIVSGWLSVDAGDHIFLYLFLLHAFIFGIGFLAVSVNPDRSHAVIGMGALAQVGLFALVSCYVQLDKASNLALVPAIIDLVFAILFAVFLWSYRWQPAKPGSDGVSGTGVIAVAKR